MINKKLKHLYVESMTLRGMARYLKCDYKTVVRKFEKYSTISKEENDNIKLMNKRKSKIIQIDEMYTFINSKDQKMYFAMAVSGFGKVIGFVVGENRWEILDKLFEDIETYVSDETISYFDDYKRYQLLVDKYYPNADYVNMKGRESDPYLKHLNFVCALIRNRLSRMARKSWCFSRSEEKLQLHLELLQSSFNERFKDAS